MSNRTYVCVACRRAARAEAIHGANTVRRCPECQSPLVELHRNWRIPKRNDDKGWKRLRVLVRGLCASRREYNVLIKANMIKHLERKIELAHKLKNEAMRTRRLKQLSAELKRAEIEYGLL